MTPQEERLAEALWVERFYGDKAVEFIASRVRDLTTADDKAGVRRWREIAAAYDLINPAKRSTQ